MAAMFHKTAHYKTLSSGHLHNHVMARAKAESKSTPLIHTIANVPLKCRYEEGNPTSYATVTVTNAGADYTKLGEPLHKHSCIYHLMNLSF